MQEITRMKISKVTKESYTLEDGREFFFDEPLEKVPTVKQLQKMLDKNKEIIEGIKNATID
jgi:hypothetical protein